MYLSTSLNTLSGIRIVEDKVNFTYGIKPDSIPYNTNYGIRIRNNSDKSNIRTSCEEVLSKLKDNSLSVSDLTIVGRNIDLSILYKETNIDIQLVQE
jgi:hypothetical protein